MTFAALAEEWQPSWQHLAVRSQETTWPLPYAHVLPVIGRLPIAATSTAKVERMLTAITSRELEDAVPDLGRPAVLFLRLAGSRFSEMAALTVDDVIQTPHGPASGSTERPRSPRSPGAIIGSTKTHQTWTVPTPAAAEGYARRRVATAGPGALLFPSPTGGMWTNTNFQVRCRWTEVTTTAGLAGSTIRDLRHTPASVLLAAGADVKAAQVTLGHATATMTTNLYGHLFSGAQ